MYIPHTHTIQYCTFIKDKVVEIKPLSDYELLPIYVRVADNIRTQLGSGAFPIGSYLPSELELSKVFNLSRGTIRKALDILETEGRISRQPGRGTIILPPTTNTDVRRTIAVVWSIVRAIGIDLFAGLERAVADANFNLMFSTSEHDPEREAEILGRLLHSEIDGAVLYYTGASSNIPLIQSLRAKRVPLVLLDRFVPELSDQVSWVTSENEQGAFDLTRHLIELGHRRIALVVWTPDEDNINTVVERRAGYNRALREAGIEVAPILSVCGMQSPNIGVEQFAERFFRFLEEERPTAVFFNNDATTFRLYPYLLKGGIKIPEDLSIAGFDGLRLPFDWMSLNLTTVVQNFERMGAEAGQAIARLIHDPSQDPVHLRVPVTLRIGATTAPPQENHSAVGKKRKEGPIGR